MIIDIIIMGIVYVLLRIFHAQEWHLYGISLGRFVGAFIPFFVGILLRKHKFLFNACIYSDWFYSSALILFVGVFSCRYLLEYGKFWELIYIHSTTFLAIMGSFIVFHIFAKDLLVRFRPLLSHLGRMTLPIYMLHIMFVIQIPTNKPVIREDATDLLYPGKEGKYNAIIKEIENRHATGQPVLVGTIAIETSELLSKMLTKKKIPHEVLNAKNHAREAEIIAHAGEKGAVTIATNMAGRGTDIKLGEGVKELGGLCVIGSERHESRRIDNQLRGRSGRQGDPGFTQFFVSFEDDLLVRFGSDRYKDMLKNLGFTGDMAIQNKMFSKTVESAQRKVEGNNFDIRKQLLNYDDVMNNQREIIYGKRNEILDNDSIHETVLNGFKEYISDIVNSHLVESNKLKENDYSEILEAVNENLLRKYRLTLPEVNGKHPSEVINMIYENALKDYEEKLEDIPEEVRDEFEKAISLRVIDNYWMEHISTMTHLRDGIGLRGYANTSPLQAYTMEGYQLFDEMLAKINRDISIYLLKSEIRQNIERKQVAKNAITNDSKDHAKVQKKSTKVGRNDPCPCGSGKKYKNCCGK